MSPTRVVRCAAATVLAQTRTVEPANPTPASSRFVARVLAVQVPRFCCQRPRDCMAKALDRHPDFIYTEVVLPAGMPIESATNYSARVVRRITGDEPSGTWRGSHELIE